VWVLKVSEIFLFLGNPRIYQLLMFSHFSAPSFSLYSFCDTSSSNRTLGGKLYPTLFKETGETSGKDGSGVLV